MKKNISLALAALLCIASPGFTQEPEPKVVEETQQRLGNSAIAAIRKAYKNGEYGAFLKEMEADYQGVCQKGELANLADFRMGPADEQWVGLEKTLRKERGKELLSLVAKEDSSSFVQKVRSAATELSPEVQEAFSKLFAFQHMAPGSGKNDDENRLIDLDLAYEYKALHLDRPLIEGQALSDAREKHYVLMMEKMDKMVEASKSFKDTSLRDTVALAAKNFDAFLAQSWDRADLSALAKGRSQPATKLEEKTAEILNSHQEKFAELSKQLLDEQTKQ